MLFLKEITRQNWFSCTMGFEIISSDEAITHSLKL